MGSPVATLVIYAVCTICTAGSGVVLKGTGHPAAFWSAVVVTAVFFGSVGLIYAYHFRKESDPPLLLLAITKNSSLAGLGLFACGTLVRFFPGATLEHLTAWTWDAFAWTVGSVCIAIVGVHSAQLAGRFLMAMRGLGSRAEASVAFQSPDSRFLI